jgi:hypothetical protein
MPNTLHLQAFHPSVSPAVRTTQNGRAARPLDAARLPV